MTAKYAVGVNFCSAFYGLPIVARLGLSVRRPLVLATCAVILAGALVFSGCDDPEEVPPAVLSTEPGQGGSGPPAYDEPLLIKDGDYWPEGIDFALVAEQGTALSDEDAGKPDFEGTVAGIRLYSFATTATDPSADREWCVVDQFVESDALATDYVPSGTFANGPAYAGLCPDGSASFIQQEFTTKHGSFEVKFYYGEPAFGHDASRDRVSDQPSTAGKIVVIEPVTEEGFGRGWVARAAPDGVFIVDARNLPVSELTSILSGLDLAS